MDVKKVLGKRIQDYRKSKKLTQEQLAEMVKIDTISLSKIETGKNYPTAENLAKIAQFLDVEVYELFICDSTKTNKELLFEINQEIEKFSGDIKNLRLLCALIKNFSNEQK